MKAISSINQILDAFQRMPAITDLHLRDSIPDDSEGPYSYPVVDLPYLRVLSISSGTGTLTTVLPHITFPHSAVLDLTCKEKQSTQIDFSNFLSVLTTKFLSSLVIRSLSLRVLDDIQSTLEFCLYTTAIIQDCCPFESSLIPQFQLQLVLTWLSSWSHSYVKVLTCAVDIMSLPFLTQLRISTYDYIDSQTWVNTFGSLPSLEWVCLQGSASHRFLGALDYKTKAAEKLKTAYCNVSIPKLRYVYLDGTSFERTNLDSISVDMLLDYLMERCERNVKVQVFRMDYCYPITSVDVKRLKEIVIDVIWDGEG